jgi:hypothetical protein
VRKTLATEDGWLRSKLESGAALWGRQEFQIVSALPLGLPR